MHSRYYWNYICLGNRKYPSIVVGNVFMTYQEKLYFKQVIWFFFLYTILLLNSWFCLIWKCCVQFFFYNSASEYSNLIGQKTCIFVYTGTARKERCDVMIMCWFLDVIVSIITKCFSFTRPMIKDILLYSQSPYMIKDEGYALTCSPVKFCMRVRLVEFITAT